ncbi:hypothetical protein Ocin01_15634, partial [Orchesella cincta]
MTRGFEPGRVSMNRLRQPSPGVIDFIRIRNGVEVETSRHTITLTDNQSFIFFTNCNLQTNRRSWDIMSTQPQLSAAVRRRIEQHATAQGFARENFAFMRYDSCRPGVVSGQGGQQEGNRNQRGSSSGGSNISGGRWNKN